MVDLVVPRRLRRAAALVRRGARRRILARSVGGPLRAAADRHRWSLDAGERELLAALDAALEGGPDGGLADDHRPRVAVLSAARPQPVVRLIRTAYPGATVIRVDPRQPATQRHARLAASGPFDLVVDDSHRPGSRGRLFEATFGHVSADGAYVALDHPSREGRRPGARKGSLTSVLETISRRGDDDAAALADSVAGVDVRRHHAVVRCGRATLAKMSETEMNRVLRLRGDDDRVLARVPATSFASRSDFTSSVEGRDHLAPASYHAPVMSLREYHDVLCVPGQVAVQGSLVLPDTYRHNQRRRLRNRFTEERGRRFAALPAEVDADAAELRPGTWFYLDDEVRGHFGHAMTEQLSRLWALPLARRVAPDLKALLTINKGRELQPFEIELYGAAGFAPDQLVLERGPVRVERLLGATPMLSMPDYVHPEIAETWQRVGDTLHANATHEPGADRLFISRRIRKRACLNTPDVEALFAEHGFAVVYPEDHPLADQVAMFRRAGVIAGFAGSGLFNICFAPTPKRVIMLSHTAYSATNEHLMASVLGHDLVSVVSEIDRTERDEEKGVNAFQSSFRVDFEREGRYLTRVLESL